MLSEASVGNKKSIGLRRNVFSRRHKEIPTHSKTAQAFEVCVCVCVCVCVRVCDVVWCGVLQSLSFSTAQMEKAIIRVHAPFFMRVTMAVGLSYDMTANDIVQKLKKKSQLNEDVVRRRASLPMQGTDENVALADVSHFVPVVVPEEQFVFEIGGNIGEWVCLCVCMSHLLLV